MASLRWVADGIEVAEKAGGVTLDRKHAVGFARKAGARQRPQGDLSVSGFEIETDPDPYDDDADAARGGRHR